jgi:hypothetical protein
MRNIILPSTPRSAKLFFHSSFQTKFLYTFFKFLMRPVCSAHFFHLHFIIPANFVEVCKIMKHLVMQFYENSPDLQRIEWTMWICVFVYCLNSEIGSRSQNVCLLFFSLLFYCIHRRLLNTSVQLLILYRFICRVFTTDDVQGTLVRSRKPKCDSNMGWRIWCVHHIHKFA